MGTQRLKVIISNRGYKERIVLAQRAHTLIHTHTVPSTGLQNAACSTFSILWECAVIQQFRVGAERQDLETKRGVSIKGGRDKILHGVTAQDRKKKMTDTNLVKEEEITCTETEESEGKCYI